MKVFLIAGKAGSGKNEVASIIKKELGSAVVTSFSKYIKLYTMELTGWDGNDDNKPREYLQTMGDKLRAIDKDFLTKRIYEDIEVYEKEGISNVIVSDVRLVNEIEYFKNLNIDVVTIRVNSDTSKRILTDKEKAHHTELALDDYKGFDYIIENEFNENLKEKVKEILKGMK